MAEYPIPATVRELVCERVHSIEQLEVLLLLHARADEVWTVEQVAETLRITPALACSALEHLADMQLTAAAEQPNTLWRYAPRSDELARQVRQLADAYRDARVETLVLISTFALDRVRKAGLRTFAQAFLLKPPKKDGGK